MRQPRTLRVIEYFLFFEKTFILRALLFLLSTLSDFSDEVLFCLFGSSMSTQASHTRTSRWTRIPSTNIARLVTSAAGTPFLDGYSTGAAAFLIILIPKLSAWDIGLFTSLYFVGFSLGAPVIGRLADRFGRRKPFLWTFCALIPAVLLGSLSAERFLFPALLLSRFLCGFLLGGDYPVSQALVTELAPEKHQRTALSTLMLAWYIGAILAVLLFLPIAFFDLPWQTFAWLETFFVTLFLLGRFGIPESPVWLARYVAQPSPPSEKTVLPIVRSPSDISSTEIRRRFLFCAFFWSCQTIPATVLMLYSSRILESITGPDSAFSGVLLLYTCFLVGVLPALHPTLLKNPRRVLFGTFVVMALALACVAATFDGATSNVFMTSVGFILFAIAYGLQTPLDFVIPNTILPDNARARLVGILTMISRVSTMGAALLFPALAELVPINAIFLGGTLMLLAGAATSLSFAPAQTHKN